jgi:hypothetical protein
VIVQFTAGGFNGASEWLGQSFTTPSGGPWHDITFNFFSGGNPLAAGTAYLFSTPYNGLGSDLSSASDLATSTGISNGEYEFDPTFTLQPATTYYLYIDTSLDPDFDIGGPGGSTYGDGGSFSTTPETYDYRVSGDVGTGVPEPTTIGLSALGGAFLVFARRRRHENRKPTNEPLTSPTALRTYRFLAG